jgi:hypothetical protein
MANHVFVVIEFGDEHFEVLGVFSSKEKAEKFSKEKKLILIKKQSLTSIKWSMKFKNLN